MCLSIPAKIEKIYDETALCSVGGSTYEANLQLLAHEQVREGDYVLIHTGFAIQKLDEEDAKASLDAFAEFSRLNIEMDEEEKKVNKRLI
ncbi:MAG: HypC/HybG/HupF family hydrogenase formation chaperone [Nitrospiraceae bacterium]|nr:HypC/HybG/HupF family hydrogenase formation chaperone [Nitrospiraceae bacterium]